MEIKSKCMADFKGESILNPIL